MSGSRRAPHRDRLSGPGTFETCQPAWNLSAYRGRPEVIGARSKWRVWPWTDMGRNEDWSYPTSGHRSNWSKGT